MTTVFVPIMHGKGDGLNIPVEDVAKYGTRAIVSWAYRGGNSAKVHAAKERAWCREVGEGRTVTVEPWGQYYLIIWHQLDGS